MASLTSLDVGSGEAPVVSVGTKTEATAANARINIAISIFIGVELPLRPWIAKDI
ncbi:MAG: hypothetical protein IH994_08430 [Proteobacteria bacterium]|nr:hypothetical protein [Pseudomonadota bacterium]